MSLKLKLPLIFVAYDIMNFSASDKTTRTGNSNRIIITNDNLKGHLSKEDIALMIEEVEKSSRQKKNHFNLQCNRYIYIIYLFLRLEGGDIIHNTYNAQEFR